MYSFCLYMYMYIYWASQVVLVVKPANAGDVRDSGLIPGLGRCPVGGHGNPLQYSCLENLMDRGALQATVCWVSKSQTLTHDIIASMHPLCNIYVYMCVYIYIYIYSVCVYVCVCIYFFHSLSQFLILSESILILKHEYKLWIPSLEKCI